MNKPGKWYWKVYSLNRKVGKYNSLVDQNARLSGEDDEDLMTQATLLKEKSNTNLCVVSIVGPTHFLSRDKKTNSLLEVHLNWTYCEKSYALANAEAFFQLEGRAIHMCGNDHRYRHIKRLVLECRNGLTQSLGGRMRSKSVKEPYWKILRTWHFSAGLLCKELVVWCHELLGHTFWATGLTCVPIPKANIYPIKDNLSPEKAAEEYEHRLKQFVANKKLKTSAVTGMAKFDLMLLGMGLDGHDASRFCWHFQRFEKKKWVTFITDSPKLPPPRISFTFPPINSTYEIAMVVTGDDAADAVKVTLGEHADYGYPLPVQKVDIIGIGCYSFKDLCTWKNEVKVLAAEKTTDIHDLHKQANLVVSSKKQHVDKRGCRVAILCLSSKQPWWTIKMAVGAFGGEGSADGSDVPPLMAENKGESNDDDYVSTVHGSPSPASWQGSHIQYEVATMVGMLCRTDISGYAGMIS
ncbi:probable 6-phosphogluconolactonase 4, chloroplastic [Tanacetum coccineum]